MPRILFSTLGSLGDLYPLLAVARALRDRGTECLFAVHSDQVPLVDGEGFAVMPNSYTLADFAGSIGLSEDEVIRKTFSDPNFLFRDILPFDLENVARQICAWMGEVDLVATTFQAEAARLAAETAEVPIASLILQPMMVFDPSQPPLIPAMPPVVARPGRVGQLWNRAVLSLGLFTIRMAHGHRVNRVRQALELPKHTGVPWFEPGIAPRLSVGLYPAFLHDHAPDLTPPVTIAGFVPYNGPEAALDPELDAFLDAGTAPIVFTLGSNATFLDQDFYAQSLAAARDLGQRCVLLTGAGWDGTATGDDVIQRDYVPHHLLFERASMIVHHGGIGTFCRAMAAGKPQLIVPFGTDQPDNAARAERMGFARTLPAGAYSVEKASGLIGALLNDANARQAATVVAARMAQSDGPAVAADALLSALTQASR